jgi:hypothetical protein
MLKVTTKAQRARRAGGSPPTSDSPAPRLEFKCPTCEDSGEVVPSAFHDDHEPWPRWIVRGGGNPLIHPRPCPACRPEESAAARERLRNR